MPHAIWKPDADILSAFERRLSDCAKKQNRITQGDVATLCRLLLEEGGANGKEYSFVDEVARYEKIVRFRFPCKDSSLRKYRRAQLLN